MFQSIREILLVGHRQAFAWIDEWHGMSFEDVRKYESQMQNETNKKIESKQPTPPETPQRANPSTPTTPVSPTQVKSWFSWS